MKKLLYILCIGFVLAACSSNDSVEVGQKTSMMVEPVFNAGTVLRGEIINAKFIVKNTGDYPLVIGDVHGSCSCTVAEKPSEMIQPGEEGIIKANVNTENFSGGVIVKSVTIVANTEPSVTEVVIKAKVK